jgi:hypothetical protein
MLESDYHKRTLAIVGGLQVLYYHYFIPLIDISPTNNCLYVFNGVQMKNESDGESNMIQADA